MVDIEFAVQYLVLAHAHDHPDLTRNAGNIALLKTAATHGLVPTTSRTGWRRLSRVPSAQHAERLTRRRRGARRPCGASRLPRQCARWTHVFGAPWRA
jgi:glutamate-ammonia-ligase adenylyltransferase